MRYCKRCLMPDTRPRITFNDEGICNACVWAEEKEKQVDWDFRWNQLVELCERHKNRNKKKFDCILPVSGGKDSSYVAYKMKHEMGMNPLAVTIAPPARFAVGDENLENFIDVGFDHLRVTPNPKVGQWIAKKCFIEQGQPLLAWIMSVQTVIFKIATMFDIPLVMFGEEGEVEYGGTNVLKNRAFYDVEESIALYLSGNDPKEFLKHFSEKELYWWLYPSSEEMRSTGVEVAKWSYFENWDPYEHYLFSKEKCGLKEKEERCTSTYNNFGQTDTILYDLHVYLMYLKFGFGRCSQDVGIDIRRGAMSRSQGLALVKLYDGEYPAPYIDGYLKYFEMTQEEFDSVLDRHANKELFHKKDGRWVPSFTPQ